MTLRVRLRHIVLTLIIFSCLRCEFEWNLENKFKPYSRSGMQIIPNHGQKGDTIMLRGERFISEEHLEGVQFFDEKDAQIISVFHDSMFVKVPELADDGQLKVVFNDTIMYSDPFTYDKPMISSISPIPAAGGDVLNIVGSNFGEISEEIEVQINGTVSHITGNPTDDSIQVIVPRLVGHGNISINVSSYEDDFEGFEYKYVIGPTTEFTIDQALEDPQFLEIYFTSGSNEINFTIYVSEKNKGLSIISKSGFCFGECIIDSKRIYSGNSVGMAIVPGISAPSMVQRKSIYFTDGVSSILRGLEIGNNTYSINSYAGQSMPGYDSGNRLSMAQFDMPIGIERVQKDGIESFFVADKANNTIRLISANFVSIYAGSDMRQPGVMDGHRTDMAMLWEPYDIRFKNNILYFTELGSGKVRWIENDRVYTYNQDFSNPESLDVDQEGNVFVLDNDFGSKLWVITPGDHRYELEIDDPCEFTAGCNWIWDLSYFNKRLMIGAQSDKIIVADLR